MTTTIAPVGETTAALSELSTGLSDYLDRVEFTRLSDADLVAELRGLESFRRRLHALDHSLVAELDHRGVGVTCGARSTAGLLQTSLRLSPRDANARSAAARHLGPRRSLTGDPLEPLLPVAASAAADGLISNEHIARILDTITDLPLGLPVEDRDAADQILADIAQHGTPRDVAAAGARLLDTVNPDGQQPEDDRHEPSRGLTVHRRRDGSYQLSGRLTPECGIQTEAVLNAYATPRPTLNIDNGVSVPDQRSAIQRRHDALHDLTNLALHADTLQHTGRRAELIITTTAETCSSSDATDDTHPIDVGSDEDDCDGRAFGAAPVDESAAPEASRNADEGDARPGTDVGDDRPATGADDLHTRLQRALFRLHHHAWTTTGDRLTTPAALWLCDTALIAVVTVGSNGRILNYGQTRRFATKAQLRTLIGRDQGCSFPGCDHPPQWCEVHHIVQWTDGGPTDLENLTLVCGYHHRGFARMGWTCQMNAGIPYWTPPPHVDPCQKPIRNHAHLLR